MDGAQLSQGYSHFEKVVYRPRKDERLSWPWNHAVVLNMGPRDWESSTLTIRPLLESQYCQIHLPSFYTLLYDSLLILKWLQFAMVCLGSQWHIQASLETVIHGQGTGRVKECIFKASWGVNLKKLNSS